MRHPDPQAARNNRRARRKGIVLWLTLVAMILFIALAVYVFNIGKHVERQEAAQDAADAAAIGAAGEMARHLNLVAANNVETARLIVAAQMLDALPQAAAYTLEDQAAVQASLNALAPAGDYAADVNQRRALVLTHVNRQVELLTPVVGYFRGTDIRATTWYSGSGGQGTLWKGVDALSVLSEASMTTLGVSAELGAVTSAAQNQGTSGEILAGAVPFRASLPYKKGAFDDFYNPIMKGTLPVASSQNDKINHRGPYDTVFGQIGVERSWIGGTPSTGGTPPTPNGGSPFSGTSGGGGGSGGWPGPVIGYHTIGVFPWLNDAFRGRVGGPDWRNDFPTTAQWGNFDTNPFINTQLTIRVGRMAINKLTQVGGAWAGAQSFFVGNNPPPLYVPHWQYPFQSAKAADGLNPAKSQYVFWIQVYDQPRVSNLPWEVLKITQQNRYYDTATKSFRSQRAYDFFMARTGRKPGWVDCFFEIPNTAVGQQGEGIYVDGIWNPAPPVVPGQPVPPPVLGRKVVYLWGGLNQTDELAKIENPNNWTGSATPPGPLDLDASVALPPVAGNLGPQSPWNFFAFAASPNNSQAWPAKFYSSNYKRHAGLAQATVFNNHSWDLWTQMWHAQLTPIDNYDGWLTQLQQTSNQAGGDDQVNTAELEKFIPYLESIRPMAPMITH